MSTINRDNRIPAADELVCLYKMNDLVDWLVNANTEAARINTENFIIKFSQYAKELEELRMSKFENKKAS